MPGQPSPLASGLCLNTSLAEGRLRDVLALSSSYPQGRDPSQDSVEANWDLRAGRRLHAEVLDL